MSSLNISDRIALERFLNMSEGYVLNFSDPSIGEFVFESVGLDIHDDAFTKHGTSKAKKLRAFWRDQPDHIVGKLLQDMVDYELASRDDLTTERKELAQKCREIASRLLSGSPRLGELKLHAEKLDARHLADQIRRIESSVETDPALAIGTAKELVETYCKTILEERGKPVIGTPDVPTLTKQTLKELQLVPEDISDTARGAKVIKRLLSNLGTIGNGLAELRGLYGTGHGKHGSTTGLSPRHAKLAVGTATTLTTFLYETHLETQPPNEMQVTEENS